MPGENFTKEPKEVLHAKSSIHSHSQLATQSKPAHFSTFEFNKFNVEHGAKTAYLLFCVQWSLREEQHGFLDPTDIEISCECEQGCRASEVQEFSTLPRVLILHVMRFDMLDYGEKLKDRMDIPAQLDLSDFPGVASLGKQSRSVHPQASTDCMVLCLIWGTAWTAATTSVM
ncbi:hypothetical protein SRHO_G00343700 [Serrasalmus rhombeus]